MAPLNIAVQDMAIFQNRYLYILLYINIIYDNYRKYDAACGMDCHNTIFGSINLMATCDTYSMNLNGSVSRCNRCKSRNVIVLEDLDDTYVNCNDCGASRPIWKSGGC